MSTTCTVDGCVKPVRTRELCSMHYHRLLRTGETGTAAMIRDDRRTASERFWMKVVPTGSCWYWTAAENGNGYGRFKVNGRLVPAHRFAYEDLIGPIGEDYVLDHLCRTPLCVNPDHLEPVSLGENVIRGKLSRGVMSSRDSCPAGHPYDDENTYLNSAGRRECRMCHRDRARVRRARAKAVAA